MAGKWAVFRCVDGRLNEPLENFLRSFDVPPNHYSFTLIGGTKDNFRVLTDLEFAVSRLGISRAIFVQHTDCLAYGGRIMCGCSEDADREFQIGEIRRIIDDIRKIEGLTSWFFLAHIDDNGEVSFEEIDKNK